MSTDHPPGRAKSTQPPLLGQVELPPLTGSLDMLWNLILDIAHQVPRGRWQLVGGQMVMLHGLCARRTPVRTSGDVDVLADLLSRRNGLQLCVRAAESLRFEPVEALRGDHIYRFRRATDGATIDILAPDHSPPGWPLRTVRGKDTIQVPGGHQALKRAAIIEVTKGDRSAQIPVPDLLGALVLKSAAWLTDSRDRDRHSGDAAFLVSLVADPLRERNRFAGSDRHRLKQLNTVLGDPHAAEWAALGDHANDAFAAWRILLSAP